MLGDHFEKPQRDPCIEVHERAELGPIQAQQWAVGDSTLNPRPRSFLVPRFRIQGLTLRILHEGLGLGLGLSV